MSEREQKFYSDLTDDLFEVSARAAARAQRERISVVEFCGAICAAFVHVSFEVLVEAMSAELAAGAIAKAADHLHIKAAAGETVGTA